MVFKWYKLLHYKENSANNWMTLFIKKLGNTGTILDLVSADALNP